MRNICVSHHLDEGIRPSRSTVIYHPVSGRAFAAQQGRSVKDGLVAFAGRLVQEKGLDLLLRALGRLPEVRLEVAGDGPMRRHWVGLAEELGVAARVRFLGPLPFEGVAELYARATLVCVPSIMGEAFGYTAAEAMAMSRAVVGTPAGALRELLGAGRGFVAETISEDALARALETALVDDMARRRAVERAREFALAQLSIGGIGPKYIRIYQEAVA
jgi:D-inositol-3-phosphate glycosyltransferase